MPSISQSFAFRQIIKLEQSVEGFHFAEDGTVLLKGEGTTEIYDYAVLATNLPGVKVHYWKDYNSILCNKLGILSELLTCTSISGHFVQFYGRRWHSIHGPEEVALTGLQSRDCASLQGIPLMSYPSISLHIFKKTIRSATVCSHMNSAVFLPLLARRFGWSLSWLFL